MIENDPVHDLLIQLANSLIERYPDTNIFFTDAEFKIVNDWILKIGNALKNQQKNLPNCH